MLPNLQDCLLGGQQAFQRRRHHSQGVLFDTLQNNLHATVQLFELNQLLVQSASSNPLILQHTPQLFVVDR